MRATLEILDECNVRIRNLDLETRRKMVRALEFFDPRARYTAKYKLGKWHGKISFCTLGGATYLNLLDRVLPIIQEAGYQIDLLDNRSRYSFDLQPIDEDYLGDCNWPDGHRYAGEPIRLEEHQVRLINSCLANFQSIQEAATAAGKTIVTAALAKMMQPYGRTMVIVPNKSLILNTEKDFRLIGLDVGVVFQDRKELDHHHTICTWQMLNIYDKKKSRWTLEASEIERIAENCICVVVDEAHLCKAQVLKRLLTTTFSKVPIRWGLTGTVPPDDWEFTSLLAAIGPVASRVRAKELQDKGFLANCQVQIIQLLETLQFKTYHDEYAYLTTNQERIRFIAGLIRRIAANGNTLVLVDRIPTGKALAKLLPEGVFLHGSIKTEQRQVSYDQINVEDNQIVIATYGIASVGINIPRIFNLVLLEPGKSFVRTIQSIGRSLRRARDKDSAVIWDICSSTKYSARHLGKRKKHYKDAEYPFEIDKINYIEGQYARNDWIVQ